MRLPLWLLLPLWGGSFVNCQGDESMTTTMNQLNRDLLNGPLACNNDLEARACEAWSSRFDGTTELYTQEVMIPCGVCVVMDYPGPTLVMRGGLTVEGKLVFPDGYGLDLQTTQVLVTGELHMTSLQHVDGNPAIRFLLTGTDLTAYGKKPIAVRGGKLVIRGLPAGTPSFVPLHDFVESTNQDLGRLLTQEQHDDKNTTTTTIANQRRLRRSLQDSYYPTDGCNVNGIYVEEDFSPSATNTTEDYVGFGVSRGAHFIVADGVMMVYDRFAAWQGMELDLTHLDACLTADQPYLFTARVRLTSSTSPDGSLTTCGAYGVDCLRVMLEWIGNLAPTHIRTGQTQHRVLYTDHTSFGTKYGEWFTVALEFTMSQSELEASMQTIRIDGVPPNTVLEVDQVVFRLAPMEAVLNSDCGLVPNGNAELVGFSPYPFRSETDSISVVVMDDSGDPYFRVTGLQQPTSIGMTWDIPQECLQVAVYRFHALVRVHVQTLYDAGYNVQVKLRRWYNDTNNVVSFSDHTVATCASFEGAWTDCEGTFAFGAEMVDPSTFRLQAYLEGDGATVVAYDIDSLSLEAVPVVPADLVPFTGIVVSDTILRGWAPGAEILITSHTLDFRDRQIRTITAIHYYHVSGYVVVELDSPIVRATTEAINPDYAVEIVLLSRNIVFQAADDDLDPLIGGHLIVDRTSTPQEIRGVEFLNFGQQGNLGRYPIHLHLCEDHFDTVLAGNLIRSSNQRCIVIHGTNGVHVDSNVAFQTRGHCFMLEDGHERYNVFTGNLGASTERPQRLIPDMGTNGQETDRDAATFWITNPTNSFIGNVAAGSQVNGFWFELNNQVRGPIADRFPRYNPKRQPLIAFRDNVAHSNRRHGLRTYPDGYLPVERADFVNFKSFRNQQDGVFFHNSRNLALVGGLFADNQIQVDFDRADKVSLHGGKVIGISPEFRALRESQPNIRNVCAANRRLIGVHLHTFVRHTIYDGATLGGTAFSGFGDTGCPQESVFDFDDDIFNGSFDYFTTLSGILVQNAADVTMSMCFAAERSGVNNIYIIDLDSSLKPAASRFFGTSSIMSNHPTMTTFVEPSKCTPRPEHCYVYCEDTCFRTVTYGVNLAGTQDHRLRVCQTSDPTNCINVPGKFYEKNERDRLRSIIENSEFDDRRFFAASVPKGTYTAVFVDGDGVETWPDFVEVTYEDRLCTNSLVTGAIELITPDVPPSQCDSLIRNGGAEDSAYDPAFWLHRSGGIRVAPGAGINGTNAFGDYIQVNDYTDGIVQYLDSRCMKLRSGSYYEIKAWVKLVDLGSNETYHCNPLEEKCPFVGILADGRNKEYLARMVVSHERREFQLVHGIVRVDADLVRADKVMFYIERGRGDLAMLVDDVSMVLIPEPNNNDQCDGNLVQNGDFETGDSRYWEEADDYGFIEIVLPGFESPATEAPVEEPVIEIPSNSTNTTDVVMGNLANRRTQGIVSNSTGNGNFALINRTRNENVALTNSTESGNVALTNSTGSGNVALTNNTENGNMTLTNSTESGNMTLTNSTGNGNMTLTNSTENGNMTLTNSTADSPEANTTEPADPPEPVINFALRSVNGSAHQIIRSGCFRAGERYIARARLRLNELDGRDVSCNPGSTCPRMNLYQARGGGEVATYTVASTVAVQPDGWNLLFGFFTAPSLLGSSRSVRLAFDRIRRGVSLTVDDVSVSPLSCDELIVNGDMELGHTFWESAGSGSISIVEGFESPSALRYSGRTNPTNGPRYNAVDYMNLDCLTRGSVWRITAQIKILQRNSNVGASCVIGSSSRDTACPSFRVRLYSPSDLSSAVESRRVNAYESREWDPNGFNKFSATFMVPQSLARVGRVDLIVREFNANFDIVLDDVSIAPA